MCPGYPPDGFGVLFFLMARGNVNSAMEVLQLASSSSSAGNNDDLLSQLDLSIYTVDSDADSSDDEAAHSIEGKVKLTKAKAKAKAGPKGGFVYKKGKRPYRLPAFLDMTVEQLQSQRQRLFK